MQSTAALPAAPSPVPESRTQPPQSPEPAFEPSNATEPDFEVPDEPDFTATWPDEPAEQASGYEPVPSADQFESWTGAIKNFRLAIGIAFFAIYLVISVFRFLSGTESGRNGPDGEVHQVVRLEPSGYQSPATLPASEEIDPIVSALFGDGYDFDWLLSKDRNFARALVREAFYDREPGHAVTNARAYLRISIVRTRSRLDPKLSLDAARLYRTWLQVAQNEGNSACRDVTGVSFFDGIPHLDEAQLAREQAFARRWVEATGQLPQHWLPGDAPRPALPRETMEQAEAATGFNREEMIAALGSETDARRCPATIALLDALLERPEDATPAVLASL
ncbi:hypothetical protein GRI89_12420 [Altererythrobacter salegens]|uniref:Uncharacterized protein n=1 Tax=Croceibacterium salegens TaxID=1737568 RepID=A0A6I4SWW2_9SPHN|nr:hypothetical protein [Croceibacterium salegens]MXO60343.1 hypothetical protein [Croceibacterium salegens]